MAKKIHVVSWVEDTAKSPNGLSVFMYKYVPRNATIVGEYGELSMTADTLVEQEDQPTHSGLFDQFGRPLYRVRDKIRFGFVGGADE